MLEETIGLKIDKFYNTTSQSVKKESQVYAIISSTAQGGVSSKVSLKLYWYNQY